MSKMSIKMSFGNKVSDSNGSTIHCVPMNGKIFKMNSIPDNIGLVKIMRSNIYAEVRNKMLNIKAGSKDLVLIETKHGWVLTLGNSCSFL